MSRILGISLILSSTIISTSAFAEEAQSDSIVVTATGFAEARDDVGQAISLIDRDRLDRLQAISISDALATVPGVAIARSGGIGTATGVFIRGANSSQTLVLVDGVRINDPSTPNGFFDFGSMLSGNVERVEILRGPNSIIWGSQAIGGVVDIRNAEPTDALGVRAAAEYGTHDTARATANISGKAGIFSLSAGGGYIRTDGISALANNEERDGYKAAQANARVGVALSEDVSLDLRAYYTHGKVMTDDKFESLPLSDPRSDNEQLVLYAGVNADLFDGRWQNRIAWTRTDIDRLGTDPYTDAFTPISFNVFHAKAKVDHFEYRGSFAVTDFARLVFGVEHERSDTRNHQPANAPFSPVDQRLVSKVTSEYGQLIVKPAAGLTLSGGARHDDYALYGEATTFGANAAWTPNGGSTVLRGTYAEGFRAPTMVDTLLPYGNPALKPETSNSYDLGVEHRMLDGAIVASATWFHRRSRNLVVLDSFFTPQNIGLARAKGIELTLDLKPSSTLEAHFAYSWVNAREVTVGAATFTGRQLARRPKHAASATIDWTSPLGLNLGASVRLADDVFDSDFGTTRLDGYQLVDLRAAYPVTERVELFGRAENLFDARYQTAGGYNQLGRTVYAGVRVAY